MKLKKKMLKTILLVLLFLVLLATISISVLMYAMFSSLEQVSVLNKEEIKNVTGFDLSNNVKIIGAEYTESLDNSLYLSIDISAEELKKLFPENKYNPSKTIRYLKNDNTRERKWFSPDSISDFKSFNYTDSANNSGIYVLYEDSDAAIRKVYILWFSM